jgi:hypothetical protein
MSGDCLPQSFAIGSRFNKGTAGYALATCSQLQPMILWYRYCENTKPGKAETKEGNQNLLSAIYPGLFMNRRDDRAGPLTATNSEEGVRSRAYG